MSEGAKVNQLEEYLRGMILEELRKRKIELNEADAKQIVENIIPVLDDLVAKRMKQHFTEIAEFVIRKFDKENE